MTDSSNLEQLIKQLKDLQAQLVLSSSATKHFEDMINNVSKSTFSEKLVKQVNDATNAIRNFNIEQARSTRMTVGGKPYRMEQFVKGYIPTGTGATGGTSRTYAGSSEMPKEDPSVNLLTRSLKDLGATQASIKKLTDELVRLGATRENISAATSREGTGRFAGYRKLSYSAEIGTGTTQRFTKYMSGAGTVYNAEEMPKVLELEKALDILAVTSGKAYSEYRKFLDLAKEKGLEPTVQETLDYVSALQKQVYQTAALNKQLEAAQTLREQASTALPSGSMAKVETKAAQLGFKPEDLKKISTEASTEISTLTYQFQDQGGIIRNATMHVTKYGEVLTDTQKRFRSFGQTIGDDLKKVTQWSLAVGLLYGSFYKLQQLLTDVIATEQHLAEVMVVIGQGTISASDAFAAISDAAQTAGESIDGIMDGYAAAYRATGNIADENIRFATTNQFLADSLVLSKLSTMDQSTAIDTLSAALRQSNKPLDQGRELLDQWVRVTKIANVDLATLATGYATLGDAADSAGIKNEELAGIIATISEISNMSGQEVANAARAIVSGFSSDQGIAAIEALGVATEDFATGAKRSFMDVVGDLYQLRQEGVMTSEQLATLSSKLGGGSRRGAIVTSFIENYWRVLQVNEEALKANQDATLALDMQTKPLQTSITKLSNAFIKLGYTLGEKGGVLDSLNAGTVALTKITEAVTDLVAVMGKSSTTTAFTLLGMGLYNARPQLQQQAWGNAVANWVSNTQYSISGKNRPITYTSEGATSRGMTGFGSWMGGNWTKVAGAAVGVGMPAVTNLLGGNFEQAAGNIVGGVVGGLITAGNPIGMAIGSSIGESLVNFINEQANWEPTFAALAEAFKKTESESAEKQGEVLQDAAKSASDVFSEAVKSAYETYVTTSYGTGGTGRSSRYGGAYMARTTGDVGKPMAFGETSEYAMLEILKKNDPKTYEKLYQQYQNLAKTQQQAEGVSSTEFVSKVSKINVEIQKLDADYIKKYREKLRKQLLSGDITRASYKEQYERTGTANVAVAQMLAAFGQELIDSKAIEGITDMTSAYEYLANLVIETGPEATDILTQMVAAIASGTELPPAAVEILQNLPKITDTTKIPSFVSADVKTSDFAAIQKRANEIRDERNKALIDVGEVSPQDVQSMMASWEPFLFEMDNGVKRVADNLPEYYTQAINELLASGEIEKLQEAMTPGIQQMDVSTAQYQRAAGMYEPFMQMLEKLGYVRNEEQNIVLTNDNNVFLDKKDGKVFQILLEKILDVNQKQLDGMYNLPEGAGFYIPLSAAQMYPEGGGTGALEDAIKNLTGAVEDNTNALVTPAEPTTMDERVDIKQEKLNAREIAENPVPSYPSSKAMERKMEKMDQYNRMPLPQDNPYYGYEYYDQARKDALKDTTGGGGNWFTNLFKNFGTTTGVGAGAGTLAQTVTPNLSTKLNLNLTYSTILQVDGRQLAMVIKPYLMSDLLKYQAGNNTLTQTRVLGS